MTAYLPRPGPPGPPGPAGGIDPAIVDAKGDLLVATANDVVTRKGVGANGTVLTADSAQADGLSWSAPGGAGIPPTIFDAKGDLLVGTANDAYQRQPLGANNTVLTADSAQAGGIKWVQVADAMVLAGSNLAKLAAVTGTPTGAKFLRDDGSWQLPGGGSLSYQQAALSADVSMVTAATWYDGATLSLVAGTWLVFGGIAATMGSGGTGQISYRLWDGTSAIASGENAGIAASAITTGAVAGVFVLGGTTTIRVAAASTRASSLIKAAILDSPVGNNATYLVALKIA